MVECRLYLEAAPSGSDYAPDEVADLGGNWQALHYLLTGKAEPDGTAASLLMEEWPDIGGSEASMIDEGSLARFGRWFLAQSEDELLNRFDPTAMVAAKVYRSDILQRAPGARDELRLGLKTVRAFIGRHAELGGGAIRVIA